MRSLASHLSSYNRHPRKPYEFKSEISTKVISSIIDSAQYVVYSPKTYLIQGGSGVGKTTELKRIIQHLKNENNNIKICYLPQNILLQKNLDLSIFLFDPSTILSPTSQTIRILHEFNLGDLIVSFREKKTAVLHRALSGGESQRLLFLLHYLNNPNVWILDEPTASQDSKMASRLLKLLIRINATIIVVSHDSMVVDFLVQNKSSSLITIKLQARV
jgi:ABC-type uncharacterized transport system fused permease/ATPase subunit